MTKNSSQEMINNLGKEEKLSVTQKISSGIVVGCKRTQCDDKKLLQAVRSTQCDVVTLVFTVGCDND
jgi:hypothetical protein